MRIRSGTAASAIGNSLVLARNLFRADAGTRFILASHGGWDHHGDIYKEGTRNHPVLIRELDPAFTSLIKDLDGTPSRAHPGKTLLDETLVVCMSEFGRTTGAISETREGREHHTQAIRGCSPAAGSGEAPSSARPTKHGGKIADPGWSANRPIYMEDIACTIYSAPASTGPRRSGTRPRDEHFTTSSLLRARSTSASNQFRDSSRDCLVTKWARDQ